VFSGHPNHPRYVAMKSLFFSPVLFACLLLGIVSPEDLAAADRSREPDARQTLAGEIVGATGIVRVDNRFGPVTVTGSDNGFGWNWELRCWADTTAEAEAYAKQCRLEVRETGGALELRLVLPDNQPNTSVRRSAWRRLTDLVTGHWSRGQRSHGIDSALQLRVPRTVTLDLNNRFGPVVVAGTRGAVNVNAQFGKVDVTDIASAVTAQTTFAAMRVDRVGSANLHNQNGSLDARHVAGDLIAATSFARMHVEEVKGRAELKNQNGTVEISAVAGNLLAATSFAELKVRNIGGAAELQDQNGNIDVDDVTGALVAATSFAHLKAHAVGGKADLKCQNGRIEATKIGGDLTAANSFAPLRVQEVHGQADLSGQNGDVSATGVSGDISAQTSFARLELDGAGQHFTARNQNGAVQIIARSPQVERIEAHASFHAIEVRLPASCQPLIRASTTFGKVKSDFPVLLADTLSDAKFAANPAPLKINLRGQNGDIRIQQLASN
jgi:DUF4097 and DUF4098 domain-containing protein YvlB